MFSGVCAFDRGQTLRAAPLIHARSSLRGWGLLHDAHGVVHAVFAQAIMPIVLALRASGAPAARSNAFFLLHTRAGAPGKQRKQKQHNIPPPPPSPTSHSADFVLLHFV